MSRRGTSELFILLGVLLLALAFLYIGSVIGSASEQNLNNNSISIRDRLMSFAEGIIVAPPRCEKIGGNACIADLTACKDYCTTTKAKKGGFCSTATTACISTVPCCCVCT